jgi:hypothetical protein
MRHALRSLVLAIGPLVAAGSEPRAAATLLFANESPQPQRQLVLRRVASEIVLLDRFAGAVVASAPAVGTDRVVIRGADGAVDDTLVIDLGEPLSLPAGIDYDGGAGGWDTLVLRGGSGRHERLTKLSPSSGVLDLDDLEIRFTNLEPITDTVPAATFSILGTAGKDTVAIGDGPLVGGLPTTTISSPTFESVTFRGKTTVVFDGLGGGDTVVFDNPSPADGLFTLIVNNVGTVSQDSAVNYVRLAVGASGDVDLPLTNDLNGLEVMTQNGRITYSDVDDITVGGVADVVGGVHFQGLGVASAGDITVTAGGGGVWLEDSTAISPAVLRTAAGDVSVNAAGGTSDLIGRGGNRAIGAPGGSVTVFAQRNLILSPDFEAPAANSITASGPVSLTAGNLMLIGGNSDVLSATSIDVFAALVQVVTFARVRATGATGADVLLSALDLYVDSPRATAVSSESGDVRLAVDRLDVQTGSPARISAPAGVVEIGTFLPNRPIDLGSPTDAAAALEISAEDVDRIDAAALVVFTDQGPISVTNPITSDAPLTLRSGGGISGGPSAALLAPTLTFVDSSPADEGRSWVLDPNFVIVSPGGAIPYAGASAVSASGGGGADTFDVKPAPGTSFTVDGNQPTPPGTPGDVLRVNLFQTTGTSKTVTSTPNGLGGQYTFSNRQPVTFSDIERDATGEIFADGFESGDTSAWSLGWPP